MLEIKNLAVDVDGKKVLSDLNLHINAGEAHALLGPNGSGKTSLLFSIIGFPNYKVVKGEVIFKRMNITNLKTSERVKMGLGIAFQNPSKIRGIKLADMLRICMGIKEEKEELTKKMEEMAKKLNFTKDFLERDVNIGFSGGEVKKSEILQLLAQNADFMLFDEPDSGVDVENVEQVGEIMSEMLQRDKIPSKRRKGGLIITHTGFILNYVKVDRAHVMLNGKIAYSGMPEEIIRHIMEEGFESCVRKCQ